MNPYSAYSRAEEEHHHPPNHRCLAKHRQAWSIQCSSQCWWLARASYITFLLFALVLLSSSIWSCGNIRDIAWDRAPPSQHNCIIPKPAVRVIHGQTRVNTKPYFTLLFKLSNILLQFSFKECEFIIAFQYTAASPAQAVIIENEDGSGSDSESVFAFRVKKPSEKVTSFTRMKRKQ
jgi:hypothetical protein